MANGYIPDVNEWADVLARLEALENATGVEREYPEPNTEEW